LDRLLRHLVILKGLRRKLRRREASARARATTDGGTDCSTGATTDGYGCKAPNNRTGCSASGTAFRCVLDRVMGTSGKTGHEKDRTDRLHHLIQSSIAL
jgi:hypothetical protein